MNIVFRCDGSKRLGLGHLVRSLTLAGELRDNHKCDVTFALREDDTGRQLIEVENYDIVLSDNLNKSEFEFVDSIFIEKRPDILVIDGKYQYTKEMILRWKDQCKVVIIGDHCPGMSSANLVIFPIAHSSRKLDAMYNWGGNGIAELCHGKEYVILSREILKSQRIIDKEIQNLKNMTITTGGSDPSGVMITLLKYLIENPLDVKIEAVIGDAFVHKEKLQYLSNILPKNIKVIPFSKRNYIKSDIAITTFGITLYELLFLGIPTLSVSHSVENTVDSKRFKKKYNCFEDLGFIKDLKKEMFFNSLRKMLSDTNYRENLREKGIKLIDGRGVKRVGEKIMFLLEGE